jgi:hypothetical protein
LVWAKDNPIPLKPFDLNSRFPMMFYPPWAKSCWTCYESAIKT